MIKVLFMIHDLGHGGAEKVLVNLVNNMNFFEFDVTVISLFGGGVNEQYLNSNIHFRTIFNQSVPGNIHFMKLLTPEQLHKLYVKEYYDIEIAYLEGPVARIISGCQDMKTKLISWIHCTMNSKKEIAKSFRNYDEAIKCYQKFDNLVFVSEGVKSAFLSMCQVKKNTIVLYNTNDSSEIIRKSKESLKDDDINRNNFNWCGIGKLVSNKGFDRMLRIQKKLVEEGYKIHFYMMGAGPKEAELKRWSLDNKISETVTYLGYQTNPYKYVANLDLYVCASYTEGFSTAATEALIVGTPVCTVEVSGMKEMLGENNEYGIVTENDDEALYKGIKYLLDNPKQLQYYKKMAKERGKMFSTENTVRSVENMLHKLMEK